MAYDWSGNELKQRHYDRLIVAALLAVVCVMITTPFMLRFAPDTRAPSPTESRAPLATVEPKSIQLARS